LSETNLNIEILQELRGCPEFQHLDDNALMEVFESLNMFCEIIVDSKTEQILDMNGLIE
jgi:hypothetical protein